MHEAGDTKVTTLHLPADHAYSDRREELSHALLKWLATLQRARGTVMADGWV
jgi:hypothetical protein